MFRNPTFARVVAISLSGLFQALGLQALAAPPQIDNIAPLGGRRGIATEVTVSGSNLAGNPRLIAPFRFQLDPRRPRARATQPTGRSS